MSHVSKLIDKIFVQCNEADVEGVISRLKIVHPEADATDENFEGQMRGVGAITDSASISPEFLEESVGSVQQMLFAAINADAAEEHEYVFDCKLFATLRIKATSKKEAEATVRDILDAASCNAGLWPNGDPVLFETSIDGNMNLIEVDGETVC